MRIEEGDRNWAIYAPYKGEGADGLHWLVRDSLRYSRKQAIHEAIRWACDEHRTGCPEESVSHCWKRLYRRGYRAVRVTVRPE